MRGAAVIADDAQHVVLVRRIFRERTKLARHFGGGRVGNACHDRADCAGNRAALARVIGDTGRHQQAADIGEAEAECAVVVGELRDFLGRELRHQHRHFQHDGPQAHGMFESRNVEGLLEAGCFAGRRRIDAIALAELHQVQRRQIAGGVVEEHVFRARVRAADFAARRAGVPVIDRGVELDARIGAGPCGVGDLLPQLARLHRLGDLAAPA